MQGLYAVGVAGVAMGIARAMLDAFIDLATRKTPRKLVRLADNAVVQIERRAHAGAAGCGARLPCGDAVRHLVGRRCVGHRRAGAGARAAGLRVCHPEAEAVADYTYKAAGVDAIFLGTPFERRFRDIHTLSQQIQSRTAHFEVVGQIMLGIQPPGPFL